MPLEALSIQGLWPILSKVPWLASLAMSWYFTPKRLAALVYVDLQPRNESARVNLAGVASFQIYLQVINLSPFQIELDRANFEFWCAGVELQTSILKKEIINSGQSVGVPIRGQISESQAKSIELHFDQNRSHLTGNIEFNSKVRSFAKDLGHLSGIQVVAINRSLQRSAA